MLHLEKKVIDLVNNKLKVNFWDKEKIQLLDNKLESMISRDENPYSFVQSILS
jgi:hypothetical protein